MIFQVEIAHRALSEIDIAFGWLCARAPAAAQRWYERLRAAIMSLREHPERCPLAPEAEDAGFELRQLLHGKRHGVYRILFEIRGDVVVVLRVRHAAQDLLRLEDF